MGPPWKEGEISLGVDKRCSALRVEFILKQLEIKRFRTITGIKHKIFVLKEKKFKKFLGKFGASFYDALRCNLICWENEPCKELNGVN